MPDSIQTRSSICQRNSGFYIKNSILQPEFVENFVQSEISIGDFSRRGWRARLGSGSDEGHNWQKDGYLVRANSPFIIGYRNSAYQYKGHVSVPFLGYDASTTIGRSKWPSLPSSSISDLNAAGATAISRCAPTKPAADALVGLAEIYREGIPHMVGSSLRKDLLRFRDYGKPGKNLGHLPASAGDEYLNYMFGWRPLLNDLRKLSRAIYESDEIIDRLTRNSGKVVRRGYHFPDESYSSPRSAGVKVYFPWPSTFMNASAAQPVYSQTVTSVKTWFNGAFTYYADLKGTSAYDRMESYVTKARHLYGIKLTPDVAWNLMPWSWLIDWETNMGDVMTNIGLFSNDGLVMSYGYVMQHKVATVTHDLRYPLSWKINGPSLTYMDVALERHQKVRRRASPWGFGVEWEDLTTRQIAILAALGISRF